MSAHCNGHISFCFQLPQVANDKEWIEHTALSACWPSFSPLNSMFFFASFPDPGSWDLTSEETRDASAGMVCQSMQSQTLFWVLE